MTEHAVTPFIPHINIHAMTKAGLSALEQILICTGLVFLSFKQQKQ